MSNQLSEAALRERIDQVLTCLMELRGQIEALRDAQAPLENEMKRAEEEYRGSLFDLQRRRRKLEDQIRRHQSEMQKGKHRDSFPQGEGEEAGRGGGRTDEEKDEDSISELLVTAERRLQQKANAIAKDELCEFVAYVIVNRSDPLLSQLGDMYRDPHVKLADMLELVPVALWEKESRRERGNLQRRLKRLLAWKEALSNKLITLRKRDKQLKDDRRYKLVLERRKGSEAWRAYISRQREKIRQTIAQYETTLLESQRLRTETSGVKDG